MTASVPAGWYPEPSGTAGMLRWWDGKVWTDHTQSVAAPPPPPSNPTSGYPPPAAPPPGGSASPGGRAGFATTATNATGHTYGDQSFGGHLQAGGPIASGYRSPFTEQVILVSQQRKIIELTNEYVQSTAAPQRISGRTS